MIVSVEERRRNVRQLASDILAKVDTRKAYADILLDQALKATTLNERDRALLTELTYGTLRWRGNIDGQLSRYLRQPLAKTDPLIRNLLRVSVYQLRFLNKIPDYAAVDEAVELARNHSGGKSAGFVNAVLRNFLRGKDRVIGLAPKAESVAGLAVTYSHPEWLVKRWIDEFGAEAAKTLMRANNERATLVLRVNYLKCTREKLLDRFLEAGIKAEATQWSPQGISVLSGPAVDKLPGFAEGYFQIQGEASQLVTYLVSPLSGERILDACAAPGGKSTHVGEFMKDEGELVAIDISARGIAKIRENAARLGLKSLRVLSADASAELADKFRKPYDRVLVDAPCSGLGTLRGHPEIKWHRDENDIRRLSRLQSKILSRVAGYLKPGGVLVYATCTLSREENEEIVESFLAHHKEFELEDAARYLPGQATHMVREKYFVALPHRDNTDGFFAARMRKVC
ncbi:MAG TPA: 16S rRNA (cytosine(967)-C(5))-methyltransferase RsmB [Verrucomicrobiae bacterium]|nr:16S rRNA (cytosine(967)-C(5))-methyltransferase RsmB [Verrucomicrobiae bacterium]